MGESVVDEKALRRIPKDHPGAKHPYIPRAKGTSPQQQAEWKARHLAPLNLDEQLEHFIAYFEAIVDQVEWGQEAYNQIVRRLARQGHPILGKGLLRRAYLALIERGQMPPNEVLLDRLRVKPVRTLSGVAPVTVMTKPHPCPGGCIFCPTDPRMPKSYLGNEPGAMRALMLNFDPFAQTERRVQTMHRLGHAVDKVELLVLGGTWSSYPPDYQEWFIRRCFDALNGRDAATLDEAHRLNEHALHRNVGLVIETRPDHVSPTEVRRLRSLGVTRVQLGVQTLDDDIAALNMRSHTAAVVREAMRLLRGAGLKIALHWMPNLLGATPDSDLADFRRFWDDLALRPDEMKIYPTNLLRGTQLYDHYLQGDYRPYDKAELVGLLVACKRLVPAYCRINRVMRDIPAPEIADGVTQSNLRQTVQRKLAQAGTPCQCIRCREVRRELIEPGQLSFVELSYDTDHSRELFLSALTPQNKLAGFLRLSLPTAPAPIDEIKGQAIIRQVQVYGPALTLADEAQGHAQHQGIGRRLIEQACDRARWAGFAQMAVTAAVGTRPYYRELGFKLGDLYMGKSL